MYRHLNIYILFVYILLFVSKSVSRVAHHHCLVSSVFVISVVEVIIQTYDVMLSYFCIQTVSSSGHMRVQLQIKVSAKEQQFFFFLKTVSELNLVL